MSDRNYRKTDQLFHQIALSGRATPELFFDIESGLYSKRCTDASVGQHVFVSGLARAGTTVLMRMLHDTDAFASLTYRDMPLVMAPNLWHKLSGRRHKQKSLEERAHGDGLLVNYDSPEALEEVFWRTFCGPDYINASRLVPMQADADTIDAFRTYVALILNRYQRPRYLSKNNNSILRLTSLAAAFPNSTILIPFRDPAAQAQSLLRQHQRFLQTHEQDHFSQKYMTWLVHHEFGKDHRRFVFHPSAEPVCNDPLNITYWLDLWIETYTYLLRQTESHGLRAIFVSYERLANEPEKTRQSLFKTLKIETEPLLEIRQSPPPPNVQSPRLSEAKALHDQLLQRAEAS